MLHAKNHPWKTRERPRGSKTKEGSSSEQPLPSARWFRDEDRKGRVQLFRPVRPA